MTVTVDRPPAGSRSPSILAQIADRRRVDVSAALGERSMRDLVREADAAPAPRDLCGRLALPGLHLIAEIKRRSPSAGSLASSNVDVAARARAYQAGGASAISVLVEPHWFGGSVADLATARAATTLPILAKEFVVDDRQLPLLRTAGADAVLLLAGLHPARSLARLVRVCRDLGLEPLVEAHDKRELESALATDARVIGINNRDLRTLTVDHETSARLRPLIPDDRLTVAESGVRDTVVLRRWRAIGFDAALVGEELMRTGSAPAAVTARVAALVSAGQPPRPGEDPRRTGGGRSSRSAA